MKKLISVILSVSVLFASVTVVFASPSDIPFDERELTVDTVSINRAIENKADSLEFAKLRNEIIGYHNSLIKRKF